MTTPYPQLLRLGVVVVTTPLLIIVFKVDDLAAASRGGEAVDCYSVLSDPAGIGEPTRIADRGLVSLEGSFAGPEEPLCIAVRDEPFTAAGVSTFPVQGADALSRVVKVRAGHQA